MLFMNKVERILVTILFLLTIQSIFANTYYYKLIKKIDGDNIYTNTRGGQFITIEDDICYDSDKNGDPVGNGSLYYERYTNGVYTYKGKCYFGEDAQYKFSSDMSLMNIVVSDGRIYVYRRTTPPEGVYTCSLIKQQKSNSSSSSGSGGYNPAPVYTAPIYPSAQNSSSTTQESSISSSPQKKWRTITYQEDCHMCRGLKYCSSCGGTGHIYGFTGNKLDCPNCSNGECSHCHGTGKVTKTKQVFE